MIRGLDLKRQAVMQSLDREKLVTEMQQRQQQAELAWERHRVAHEILEAIPPGDYDAAEAVRRYARRYLTEALDASHRASEAVLSVTGSLT